MNIHSLKTFSLLYIQLKSTYTRTYNIFLAHSAFKDHLILVPSIQAPNIAAPPSCCLFNCAGWLFPWRSQLVALQKVSFSQYRLVFAQLTRVSRGVYLKVSVWLITYIYSMLWIFYIFLSLFTFATAASTTSYWSNQLFFLLPLYIY